jgi:hypothetical protein
MYARVSSAVFEVDHNFSRTEAVSLEGRRAYMRLAPGGAFAHAERRSCRTHA